MNKLFAVLFVLATMGTFWIHVNGKPLCEVSSSEWQHRIQQDTTDEIDPKIRQLQRRQILMMIPWLLGEYMTVNKTEAYNQVFGK